MNPAASLKQQIEKLKKEIKRDEKELRRLKGFPATVRLKWVWCGKACSTCPHGPYYYGYKKNNKKLKVFYIGKNSELANECRAAQQLIKQIKHKQVLLRRLEQRVKKLSRSQAA